jgi:hypothetical protein
MQEIRRRQWPEMQMQHPVPVERLPEAGDRARGRVAVKRHDVAVSDIRPADIALGRRGGARPRGLGEPGVGPHHVIDQIAYRPGRAWRRIAVLLPPHASQDGLRLIARGLQQLDTDGVTSTNAWGDRI